MKRILAYLFSLSLIFTACGGEDSSSEGSEKSDASETNVELEEVSSGSVLKGIIKNGAGRKIFMERWGQNGQTERIAEAIIGEDGNYRLASPVNELEFYRLAIEPVQAQTDYINVFLEPQKTTVLNGDANNLFATFTVKGSKHMEPLLSYYNMVTRSLKPKLDSLRTVSGNLPFEDTDEREKVLAEITSLKDEINTKRNNFINENILSPGTYFIIMEKLSDKRFNGEGFNNEDLELLQGSAKVIKDIMPNSFLSKYAEVQTNNFKNMLEESTFLAPGTEVPNISMPDPNGQVRSLHDLKGKVVLLDFWASWCGPCRRDNPHVVEMYKKYNSAGFEVFSVSLDKEKGRWVAAIQQDGLVWPNHVSDLQFWNSAAAQKFKVNSIPFTVLIDREGKVIQKGEAVRGRNLDGYLKSIFGF